MPGDLGFGAAFGALSARLLGQVQRSSMTVPSDIQVGNGTLRISVGTDLLAELEDVLAGGEDLARHIVMAGCDAAIARLREFEAKTTMFGVRECIAAFEHCRNNPIPLEINPEAGIWRFGAGKRVYDEELGSSPPGPITAFFQAVGRKHTPRYRATERRVPRSETLRKERVARAESEVRSLEARIGAMEEYRKAKAVWGRRDTFPREARHALTVAYEKAIGKLYILDNPLGADHKRAVLKVLGEKYARVEEKETVRVKVGKRFVKERRTTGRIIYPAYSNKHETFTATYTVKPGGLRARKAEDRTLYATPLKVPMLRASRAGIHTVRAYQEMHAKYGARYALPTSRAGPRPANEEAVLRKAGAAGRKFTRSRTARGIRRLSNQEIVHLLTIAPESELTMREGGLRRYRVRKDTAHLPPDLATRLSALRSRAMNAHGNLAGRRSRIEARPGRPLTKLITGTARYRRRSEAQVQRRSTGARLARARTAHVGRGKMLAQGNLLEGRGQMHHDLRFRGSAETRALSLTLKRLGALPFPVPAELQRTSQVQNIHRALGTYMSSIPSLAPYRAALQKTERENRISALLRAGNRAITKGEAHRIENVFGHYESILSTHERNTKR